MTENEAIKELSYDNTAYGGRCTEEVRRVAIHALSEIQQYRAIGTVEGYKRAIEVSKENYYLYAEYKAKLKEYESIGTIDEFKALKEKSEPKKAKISRKHHEAYCPICKEFVSDGEFWVLSEYTHYCEYCGQAIWGTEWE